MHTITLPSHLTDSALETLIPLLNAADQEDAIKLDFKHVNFYYPTATVAILARCMHWLKQGKKVYADNFNECPASSYLKRIDFFGELGLQLEENFVRRPTNGKFVTIRRIDKSKDVDKIAKEVADYMAWGADDLQKIISYVVCEIITNVAQHSKGEGFLAAQRYQGSNSVHFAVADSGIGLRKSFDGTSLEPELTTPLLALKKSMEPFVSSALLRPLAGPYDEYVNRGIGLSMVNELAKQTYGHMDVLTENAHFKRHGSNPETFQENVNLTNQGVLVSMHINTDEIDNFQNIITDVRKVVHSKEHNAANNELDEWTYMFQ